MKKKLLLSVILFISILIVNPDNSVASHPWISRMAPGFYHNNGSTNWEVAYKFWFNDGGGSTPNVWFKWTNVTPNFVSSADGKTYDWGNATLVDPPIDFGPNSGRHPPYNIQWGTTCIDPVAPPSYVSSTFNNGIRVYLFRVDVTAPQSGANNSGLDVSYAYGNAISGRTDQCPFPPRYSCSTNGSGNCNRSLCDLGGSNCYTTNSCGSTRCNGPISGQVFTPGGAPLNGVTIQRDGDSNTNQDTRNINGVNGSYRYGGLNMFSTHSIKLLPSSIDQCAYYMNNYTKSATVINNNVDFNLSSVLYNINAHAYWNPEADATRNGDYTRDNITFTTDPGGRTCSTSDGTCTISGNPTVPGGRSYDITLSGLQAGDIMYTANPVTRNIVCGGVTAPFEITKGYRIEGNIFKDLNYNGTYNTTLGETLYTLNTTITLQGTGNRANITRTQVVSDGSYLFNNLFRGTYVITINDPAAGYRFSTPKSFMVTVAPIGTCATDPTSPQDSCVTVAGGSWNGSIQNLNFGITPIYSVSGGVIDQDGNPIAGNQKITITESDGVTAPNPTLLPLNTSTIGSSFNFSYLLQKVFKVIYSWTPDIYNNYDVIGLYTLVGAEPTYTLNLNRPTYDCSNMITNAFKGNAICSDFGITNLNFILQKITQGPWMQTFGGDVRLDQGIRNEMPDNQKFSELISGISTYGIIFNKNDSTINLGTGGKFNEKNWHVEDAGLNGLMKLGYDSLKDSIKKSGNVSTPYNCSNNCRLSNFNGPGNTLIYELTSGSGIVNVVSPFNIPNGVNKNYIFLVPGNLNINTNITVPTGSTLIFAVKGKITIDGSVQNLQGIYASDGDFEFGSQTTKPVPAPDTQIIIDGSIIVGQTLMRTRKLTNRQSKEPVPQGTPTIIIRFRPDFVLNMPPIIRTALSKRIEVTPGN